MICLCRNTGFARNYILPWTLAHCIFCFFPLLFSCLLYFSVFICVYVLYFLCYHELVNKELYLRPGFYSRKYGSYFVIAGCRVGCLSRDHPGPLSCCVSVRGDRSTNQHHHQPGGGGDGARCRRGVLDHELHHHGSTAPHHRIIGARRRAGHGPQEDTDSADRRRTQSTGATLIYDHRN